MNDAAAAPAVVVPNPVVSPFTGGIHAGRFFVGDRAHVLILSPKTEGELIDVQWGSTKKNVADALSCSNGLANTLAMEAAGSNLAAGIRALRIGGFDDWYLPSRIEALMLFAELRGEFERDWYWTSTQDAGDAEYAWYQVFDDGYQYYGHKNGELRARAVRRVPI